MRGDERGQVWILGHVGPVPASFLFWIGCGRRHHAHGEGQNRKVVAGCLGSSCADKADGCEGGRQIVESMIQCPLSEARVVDYTGARGLTFAPSVKRDLGTTAFLGTFNH